MTEPDAQTHLSRNVCPPFEAYNGKDPYIFVSYSHADSPLVYPEMASLWEQGYRIWYDEGIDPGNEWPEEVAFALAGCALFVAFISPHAIASPNVRNEIHFALGRKKPFLAIHLVETQLPVGLELSMGTIQAVMKYRMAPDRYRRKLDKTLSPALRFDGHADEPVATAAPPPVTPPEECFAENDREIEMCLKYNDFLGLVAAYANRSALLVNDGRAAEAVEALRCAEKITSEHQLHAMEQPIEAIWKGLIDVLGDRAAELRTTGDIKGALRHWEQQEVICRDRRDLDTLETSLRQQAITLAKADDIEGAMIKFKEQEDMARQSGKPLNVARSLLAQAGALHDASLNDRAIPCAQEAEEIATEAGLHSLSRIARGLLTRARS